MGRHAETHWLAGGPVRALLARTRATAGQVVRGGPKGLAGETGSGADAGVRIGISDA